MKKTTIKLNHDNDTLSWRVKTDFTKDPLELIIDTGSQIGLAATDTVGRDTQIQKPIYQLTGITGKENKVGTDGEVMGNFITDDNMKWLTQIHLINRKYAGRYDGYVGYDFLEKYGARIDLHEKILELYAPPDGDSKMKDGTRLDKHSDEVSRHKKVGFLIPEENSGSNGIRIGNIQMKTCQQDTKCDVCGENWSNLQANWSQYAGGNENLLHKSVAMINRPNNGRDMDFELIRLRKLEKSGIKLPPHAQLYVKTFSMGNENMITKENRAIVIRPGMTREEIIMENLPLEHADEETREKIYRLVKRFPMQFYVDGDKLGKTDIIQHKIHLKSGTPILFTPQYRLSETMRRAVIAETKMMEEQGVIQRSVSPFNTPAFMVKKKDAHGGYEDQRFVMNFVKVNEHTELRDFPIPRIEQLVDNFSGCKFFSTFDIKSAFHQIELHEPHREITAFTAGYTKYEWTRMPEGLCGAPLTMQEGITRVFEDLLEKGVNVYVDDVSVANSKTSEHDDHLFESFLRLEKHNLQVKVPKCNFYVNQFEFLGFVISDGHIRPNPNKVEAILALAAPTSRKKLQTFLGMVNYYRKFLPGMSHLTKPLNKLTSPKVDFEFDEECRRAFNGVKEALAKDVILRIPVFSERFYISCDASNLAIGAVLAQGKPPDDKPIQFFSKSLNPQQQRWTAMERECLALVTAVKEFAPYLQGREFTLITDNLALVYINKHNDAYSKLFRMRMDLMGYKYTIVYRPEVQNRVADALTRLEYEKEYDLGGFLEKYSEELDIKGIRAITRSGINTNGDPSESGNWKPYVINYPNLATENDEYDCIYSLILASNRQLLWKLVKNDTWEEMDELIKINDRHYLALLKGMDLQAELKAMTNKIIEHCKNNPEALSIAVNTDLRAKHLFIFKWLLEEHLKNMNVHIAIHTDQIIQLTDPRQIQNAMEMYHTTRLGGHCGIQRMISTMKRVYTWPTMIKDIKEYVNTCAVCDRTKTGRHTRAPLLITSVGEKAFDHVFIDYMGPVIASEYGHTYIFVATCDLTKYSIAVPTMGHTAPITAECFMKEIILKFGFPSTVTSDRGAEFLSEMFKELNTRLQIKQISTTPYRPNANIVERQNRNLNQYLRAYVDKKPQIWATLLPYATFAYNITVHSRTGHSPFHLLYGREVTLPDAITKSKPIYNYDNYVDVLTRELHDAWALAKEKLLSAKIVNKHYYDEKTHDPKLEVGDMVYTKNEVKKHKWDSPKLGPYKIISIPSDQYVILDVDGTQKKVHRDKTSKSKFVLSEISEEETRIINAICTFY